MSTIGASSEAKVEEFLLERFQVRESCPISEEMRCRDMKHAAVAAKFLSDEEEFVKSALEVGKLLQKVYDAWKFQIEGHTVRGAFSLALRTLGPIYGFSERVLLMNQAADNDDAFYWALELRCLFRDLLTRPHGEFTHAVQWLTLAEKFGPAVAGLYSRSGSYVAKLPMDRNGKPTMVTLWQWIADCFPGNENFETNIYARTFRCPQELTKRMHSHPRLCETWLGSFIHRRRTKGTKAGEKATEGGHYLANQTIIMRPELVERVIPNYEGRTPRRVYCEHWHGRVLEKMLIEIE